MLCLDESLSMHGQSMQLLQQFMDNLDKGVPGLKLWLRILFFGGEVVDKNFYGGDDGAQRHFSPLFREIVDSMSAQGSTSISAALLRGVEICTSHLDQLHDCRGFPALRAAHVICLTDGQANEEPDLWLVGAQAGAEAIDGKNIFVRSRPWRQSACTLHDRGHRQGQRWRVQRRARSDQADQRL